MIYTNPNTEVLSEDAQILTEGFTINKNPPADFYKIALDIVNEISKKVGELPAENLFNKGRKMSEIKAFSKAADRAIQGIEFNKKYKKRTKFSVSLPIYSLSLGEDSGSKALFDAIGKPIANNGFRAMNESKKFLKKLFQTIYLYRTLSDKSFMVMTYSVTYTTNYGVFAGWSTIKLAFKAVVNDEKSLRALNIMEAGNTEPLSEGIFDRFKKSKIDNKKPVSNKPEPKHKSEAKAQIKKNDFTNEQFEEIYDKSDAILEKHWNGMISEIKKIISKTSVSSAYKLYPYEGCEYMRTDIWGGVGFEFPCVFTSSIGIDITNVEPNARTDYDTSPAIKAVNETNKNIIECIKKYFKKYGITLYAIETGDWDTYNIDIFIPIKNLELSFQIPTLEFAIFESVEFI